MYDYAGLKPTIFVHITTNVEASMARDILENEGISCMLTNETFSGIYPIGHTSLGGIQLLVFEKDVEAANQILDKVRETTP